DLKHQNVFVLQDHSISDTRTFFFLSLVLFTSGSSLFMFSERTATNAQSCLISIKPNSSDFSLPCFINKPAMSPFEILSRRPPVTYSVVQPDCLAGLACCSSFGCRTGGFSFLIKSGSCC